MSSSAHRSRQAQSAARPQAKKPAKSATPRLSPRKAPEEMQPDDWQRALRRQFGREQDFGLENLGDDPVFSKFRVRNPESGRAYRVHIRGIAPGDNLCTCPDFRTNELGTCKHVEFVLARLESKRGAKAALKRGFRLPYSELFLHHGSPRALRWRAASAAPEAVIEAARAVFRVERDSNGERYLLDPGRTSAHDSFVKVCGKLGHDLRIDEAARDYLAGLRDAERRREVLAKAFPRGAAGPALAKLVKVPLYPYQAEGVLFAVQAGRALIGDDMAWARPYRRSPRPRSWPVMAA